MRAQPQLRPVPVPCIHTGSDRRANGGHLRPRGAAQYQVAGEWFLRHWNDGVVRRHPTELEIERVQREIPGVTVDVTGYEGDRLSELTGQDSYRYILAHIYVGAQDEAELTEKYRRCVRALPFEIDDEEAPTA